MPPDERQQRRDACVKVIKRNGLGHWLTSQLADIKKLSAEIDEGALRRAGHRRVDRLGD